MPGSQGMTGLTLAWTFAVANSQKADTILRKFQAGCVFFLFVFV